MNIGSSGHTTSTVSVLYTLTSFLLFIVFSVICGGVRFGQRSAPDGEHSQQSV